MDQIKTGEIPEKKEFLCDGAESRLLVLAFGMGYLFVRFLLGAGAGLAVVLFMAGVYLTTAAYMRAAKMRPVWSGMTLFWTALTVLLTVPFVLFDGHNGQMTALLFFLVCTAAVQLYSMLGCGTHGFTERAYLDWANAVFVTPFSNLGASWQTLGCRIREGRGKTLLGVLIGAVAGLPVLAMLALLLQSADGVFETVLTRGLAWINTQVGTELGCALGGIPFAMMAFGILYGCRRKTRIAAIREAETGKVRRIPASAAYGVLVPIVLLYLMYLTSQLAYFFSGFAGLLPEGYTYAEYARRGFFELCAVCVVNLVLIALIPVLFQLKKGVTSAFCTFFVLFSLVLTGTAASKMVLYVRMYGLTPLRAQTMWFMLALALAFVCIFVRLYVPRFPLVRTLAVAAAAMLLVFAYTDADVLSVSYNLHAIEDGRLAPDDPELTFAGFSGEELARMSDGIEPYLREYVNPLADSLLMSRQRDRADYRESVLYWNLASQRAKR